MTSFPLIVKRLKWDKVNSKEGQTEVKMMADDVATLLFATFSDPRSEEELGA